MTKIEPETKTEKLKFIRVRGQDWGFPTEKTEEIGDKTVIYWTTKAGQAKKTTVLTSEITQIDEDVE